TVAESLSGTAGAAAADFDGDGSTDLAIGANYLVSNATFLRIFRGAGRTPVELPEIDITNNLRRLITADVDRDGKPDLAVMTESPGVRTRARVAVFRGKGDATFEVGPWTPIPSRSGETQDIVAFPQDIAVADIDGDGAAELLILFPGRLEIWTLAAGTPLTR